MKRKTHTCSLALARIFGRSGQILCIVLHKGLEPFWSLGGVSWSLEGGRLEPGEVFWSLEVACLEPGSLGPGGDVLEPGGRVLEPGGCGLEPGGRVSEPVMYYCGVLVE